MGRPFTSPLCPGCGDTQRHNFYMSQSGRRTNAYCKECHKRRCSERYYSKNILEKRAERASQYGLTKDEYLSLFEQQGGRCAICDNEPATQRGLHVDHCHATNEVRGLLCHGCNTGLGLFKDNLSVLEKAISYLRR